MLYKIKGRVTGKDGLPVRRKLFCYNRQTGVLISETISDISTGLYELVTYDDSHVMIVCQPNSGETLNALVFDNVAPIQVANDAPTGIGEAGAAGFGVGVCPNIPNGFSPLEGHTNPYSVNFGNYQYLDGSIMVWIPAFYIKWGDGENGIPMNQPSIKDKSVYASEDAAATDGYVIHRAFIDGGEIKDGFFIDKYIGSVSAGNTHIASVKNYSPINPTFPSLITWGKTGTNIGLMSATGLRGTGFCPPTVFAYNALSALSLAHAINSASTQYCVWYGANYNYPRGGNNNAALTPSTESSGLRAFRDVSPGNVIMTRAGTWSMDGITSHNGQPSGVQDVNGNVEEVSHGVTYLGGQWRFYKESTKAGDVKFVNNGSVANGFENVNTYNSTTYPSFPGISLNTVFYRNNSGLIYPNAVDKTSQSYYMNMIGLPANGGVATNPANPTMPGALWVANNKRTTPCIGGHVNSGLNSGMWALSFGLTADSQSTLTGIRSMFIP